MGELFQDLLQATSVQDVTNLIQMFTETNEVGWRPVGARENNLATINLGSDPAAGHDSRAQAGVTWRNGSECRSAPTSRAY